MLFIRNLSASLVGDIAFGFPVSQSRKKFCCINIIYLYTIFFCRSIVFVSVRVLIPKLLSTVWCSVNIFHSNLLVWLAKLDEVSQPANAWKRSRFFTESFGRLLMKTAPVGMYWDFLVVPDNIQRCLQCMSWKYESKSTGTSVSLMTLQLYYAGCSQHSTPFLCQPPCVLLSVVSSQW